MPLLSPPPPPVRRGGSTRRLSRIRRRRSRRNWAALPLDALLHVFHKLDHVDLMFGGASRACWSWRSAAREPELWRRIDMRGHSRLFREIISVDRMAGLAILFSAGQCMTFIGEYDCLDADLILFLADQAPLLKSLHLTVLDDNCEAFADAIKKWPLLEELELCQCYRIDVTRIIELVATVCPKLKHFKYDDGGLYISDNNSEALAIARLHELRSLQIFHGSLDNKGLTIILDNCPRLEFLHLYCCSRVNIDSSLQSKCARIKTKKLYTYAYNDFTKYFEPVSITGHYYRYRMCHNDDDYERDYQFLYAEGHHDSEESDHSCYFSRAEETDLEKHERIFDKGTHRRQHRYLTI